MIKSIQLLFFFSLLFLASCGKDTITIEENAISEDIPYYFIGEVGEKNIELLVTPTNDILNYVVNDGSQNDRMCTNDYTGYITSQSETPPGFGFSLLGFYQGECSDEPEVFSSLFQEGNVPLAESRNYNLKEVNVQWEDENGRYNSFDGTQEGSSFTIIKTESSLLGERFLEIEASLNCKLYKEDDPSQSIQIENGRLRLTVGASYR